MNTTDIPLHRTAEMAVAPDCVPRLTQLAHAELDPPVLYVVYRILLVPSTKSWVRLPWPPVTATSLMVVGVDWVDHELVQLPPTEFCHLWRSTPAELITQTTSRLSSRLLAAILRALENAESNAFHGVQSEFAAVVTFERSATRVQSRSVAHTRLRPFDR